MSIRYHVVTTDVGKALVAQLDHTVCFLHLGDDISLLMRSLMLTFPNHALVPGNKDELLQQTINQLVRGQLLSTSTSIRVSGTSFQEKVWAAIRTIPSGDVRTYSDLASMIGQPKAVRAVASACAKNSIALLIPCHRVVKSDGTIGGYRWGVRRKRALLSAEKRSSIRTITS